MCLASLLIAVELVALARQAQPVTAVSDTAVIESYTAYASQGAQLVGPYSRYGWHHPGPLYFYLLAPFYSLSGSLTTGLNAGALAINLASVLLMAWVMVRAGSGVLAIVTMALVALYAWRVAPMLASPWNPHVIVLPTMALIVVCAAVLSGRAGLLPLVAMIATFVGQTHVGVLPSVLVVSALTSGVVLTAAISEADQDRRRRLIRILWVTLGVLVVLWAVPIWEQISRRPGNVTRLWDFFVGRGGVGQPFRSAYAAWTDMLAGVARPDLRLAEGSAFRRSRIPWAEGWAGAQVALLAVTAILAARAGRRFGAALSALIVVAGVTALWSATRIEDMIIDHEVFWVSGFGVLGTAVLLDAAMAAGGERRGRASPRVTAILCGLAVSLVAIAGVRELRVAATRTFAPRPQQVAAAALAESLKQRLPGSAGRPLVRIEQDVWPVAVGVLLNLQKANVPFAVEDDWLPMFSEISAATGRETTVIEITGRERHFLLTSGGGGVTLGEA
ncbi:MAG: hypothetical protein ABI868_21140, partial [Acidobacteriota bacterium]